MPATPQDMVEQFHSALPRKLSSTMLGEYGLDLNPLVIQRSTQEILSLSLFWMGQAIRVMLPSDLASHLRDGVYQSVRDAWETKYGLDPHEVGPFFQWLEKEHLNWDEMVKQGQEPIAVLNEAVLSLEAAGTIASEDHQNLLALFLDLVPIEELGEIAGRIEAELAG